MKRLGEPVIHAAVSRAMKERARQLVLSEDIKAAMKHAANVHKKEITDSYCMLGKAGRTVADTKKYHLSDSSAFSATATACTQEDISLNPGI